MHYQEDREVTLAQRCSECKLAFGSRTNRYYCCNKIKSVCDKCSSKPCKECKQPRRNALKVSKCSYINCKQLYAEDDMFFDFKGPYYICPKCMARNYSFFYSKALKDKKVPLDVRLDTKSTYPYQDLVIYFKQWCFCCANRIGNDDAFQMQKGARICPSCVQVNIDLMQFMIKCISCQGYIHNQKEVYETYHNETDVLCSYCANKQKEVLTEKQIYEQEIPSLANKKFISALEKSKVKSKPSNPDNDVAMESKASKLSVQYSFEEEVLDLPLNIRHSNFSEMCEICKSVLDKQTLLQLQRQDPNTTASILKLFEPQKKYMKLCFICFGENFTDRGQTIQFETPLQRGLENQEQFGNSPVKGVKSVISTASHGIFTSDKQ